MSGRLGIYSQAAGGGAPFAFGNALEFDGVNDFVTFSTITLTSTFTYSLWVNYNVVTGTLLASSSNPNVQIRKYGAGQQFYNGVENPVFAGTFVAGTWYNIVFVCSSGSLEMYVNGVPSATGALAFTPVPVNKIGAYFTGTLDALNGILDEVGIHSTKAASASEIASLYNAGDGNSFIDIMGSSDLNYHLDETGTATTAVDSSGNSNDGTLNNFTLPGAWVVHLPYSGPDADANAYINAGQIVDLTEIAAINQMFLDLKGTGSTTNNTNVYSDLIAFYPISSTSLAAASVNAVNPGTYDIIWNNMVAGDLTADGIKGNNSSKYGDTQIPMNTLRGVGNSFGCNVHTPGTINSRNYMGAYNSGSLFYGVFKSSADVRAYSASATAFVSLTGDANLAGNIVVDRALSTGFSAYVDGLSDGGAAASEPSVTATNPNIFLLGEGRSTGLARPTDARINIAVRADSLSANQHKDYEDAITTYLATR